MTSIDIHQLEHGKEFTNDWKSLIWNVLAPDASNEERGLLKTNLLGILEWEIA